MLRPSCPEPAQCPRGVSGDGAVLWSAHRPCNHPASLRPAYRHPLGWHPGEVLGEESPVLPVPQRGMGIWAGTGVCRCRAPAGHAFEEGPAPASPGWNLRVTGHLLPLPFPAARACGLRAIGPPELARSGMGGPRFTAPGGNGFITRTGSVSLQSCDSAGKQSMLCQPPAT